MCLSFILRTEQKRQKFNFLSEKPLALSNFFLSLSISFVDKKISYTIKVRHNTLNRFIISIIFLIYFSLICSKVVWHSLYFAISIFLQWLATYLLIYKFLLSKSKIEIILTNTLTNEIIIFWMFGKNLWPYFNHIHSFLLPPT